MIKDRSPPSAKLSNKFFVEPPAYLGDIAGGNFKKNIYDKEESNIH